MSFLNFLGGPTAHINQGETIPNPRSYRCHVAILRDEDGGFSVVVLNLPGIGSCGDSKEEALSNAREAIEAAIQSWIEDGIDFPWVDQTKYEIPEGAEQKWILVNV